MIDLATARDWVSAPATDDGKLAIMLAGVQEFIARETRRSLVTPPKAYEEILDVPVTPSPGLSNTDFGPPLPLRLRFEPQERLSGTVAVADEGTTVTGTSTKAQTQLAVGSPIRIGAHRTTVATITSDTVFTLEDAHPSGATAATAYGGLIAIHSRSYSGSAWVAVDPLAFEIDGRNVYTTNVYLGQGPRTARVRYLVGYHSDAPPAELKTLILNALRAMYTKLRRELASISIGGEIAVSWSDFGKEEDRLRQSAGLLRLPMGFGSSVGHFLEGNSSEWA